MAAVEVGREVRGAPSQNGVQSPSGHGIFLNGFNSLFQWLAKVGE